MEQSIPNLGQEFVTRAPPTFRPVDINQHLPTTPKMPQLEPTLPTPPPHYRDNQPTEKSEISKPSHESLILTKLDPSHIGNIMSSIDKPGISSKSGNRVFPTSKAATPMAPQNPFIPFSNDKDDVQSSSTPQRVSSLNGNASDKSHDRQLKAVIPSPADPIQEQPSFQDIHDMVMFSKKKPKAKNAAKQSKTGKLQLW